MRLKFVTLYQKVDIISSSLIPDVDDLNLLYLVLCQESILMISIIAYIFSKSTKWYWNLTLKKIGSILNFSLMTLIRITIAEFVINKEIKTDHRSHYRYVHHRGLFKPSWVFFDLYKIQL